MKITHAITVAVAALANQVSAAVPITGATTGVSTGSVPARRNIVDLFNEGGPQWSLYVMALSRFYEADQDPEDPESFFQVAGIHGRPIIPWDSDEQAKTQMGYCPHIENQFLPWHRPYLALFEQILVGHAIDIAEEYGDSEWVEAAETLRSPYWDWAEDATVPEFMGVSEIEVETPEGTESLHNPLYDYSFPDAAVDGQFGAIIGGDRDKTKIIRCSPSQANERLAEVDFKGMVYQAFTRSDTFDKVASMGSSNVVVAFEQPHNSIHMRAACGSHFAYTQEGAFDPLFFLHHTNIDRLWAMWEEMYPQEKTLRNTYESQGTFAMAPGQQVNGDSPLLPFAGPGNSAYTSKNVVDVTDFGYTYPEIPSGGSAEERRRQVVALVNKLYGRNSGNGRDEPSASPSASPSTSSSATSSAASSSSSADSGDVSARLPISTPSASDSSSIPASSPSAEPSNSASASSPTAEPSTSASASIPTAAPSSSASVSESGAGDLSDIPSATLSGDKPEKTGADEDDEEDDEDGGLDLPSFPELPDLTGGYEEGDGLNMTDLFPPLPDDLIPDLPDLDIGIDLGIEYMIRITLQAANIPTPSEMNIYVGEKFAGSFVVLTAPPSGCIEGEFPIRKVLDVLGLLGGLISDLIHGKIQNPIDAIKDDIHVEFVSPDGKIIQTVTEDQFNVEIKDLDFTPSSRIDELPTYGKQRKTEVKAKPAPQRPGKCHQRRSTLGDLPGVAPISRR